MPMHVYINVTRLRGIPLVILHLLTPSFGRRLAWHCHLAAGLALSSGAVCRQTQGHQDALCNSMGPPSVSVCMW